MVTRKTKAGYKGAAKKTFARSPDSRPDKPFDDFTISEEQFKEVYRKARERADESDAPWNKRKRR